MADLPRLMVAASHSGAGKTTVTLSLLSAFAKRGCFPVAFKCGPDYIDPMFHREVLNIPSYNLDLFFTDGKTTRGLLCRHSAGHGIAVVEGVMGFYDGINCTERASSYDLAKETGTPVILVVSAKGASLSLAALVKGFAGLRSPGNIAGVIINNCSDSLFQQLQKTIENETGIPCFGYLPKLPECVMENRHLGLIQAPEIEGLRKKIKRLGAQAEDSIDINGLIKLSRTAQPVFGDLPEVRSAVPGNPRIAVAQDEGFSFYYADNLELLERLGAEIVPFSPLSDPALPDGISGLYLGGGYPELYAERLAANTSMRGSVRRAVAGGMPTLAECGGFLYLMDSLEDKNGTAYPMAGVLHGGGYRTGRLQRFGYVTLKAQENTFLLPVGETIPAHEFHYWDSTENGKACLAIKPGGHEWVCVRAGKAAFAGFPHLYFYGNPAFAERFVKAAAAFKKRDFTEEPHL